MLTQVSLARFDPVTTHVAPTKVPSSLDREMTRLEGEAPHEQASKQHFTNPFREILRQRRPQLWGLPQVPMPTGGGNTDHRTYIYCFGKLVNTVWHWTSR